MPYSEKSCSSSLSIILLLRNWRISCSEAYRAHLSCLVTRLLLSLLLLLALLFFLTFLSSPRPKTSCFLLTASFLTVSGKVFDLEPEDDIDELGHEMIKGRTVLCVARATSRSLAIHLRICLPLLVSSKHTLLYHCENNCSHFWNDYLGPHSSVLLNTNTPVSMDSISKGFSSLSVLFPGILIKLIGSPRLYFSLCLRNEVPLSICVIILKTLV